MKTIVTMTMNPAIDKSSSVAHFRISVSYDQ